MQVACTDYETFARAETPETARCGKNGRMLEKEELKRRLHALRILRGYTQVTLGEALEEAGLNKTELGKVERGERLSPAMRAQLVRLLSAPESYFLEPDLDKVLFTSPDADALTKAFRGQQPDAPRTQGETQPADSNQSPGQAGGGG